ncbi:MAG: hypothetical protein PHY12_00820 [Eubacteriales bacterium]|nr:hypothetical protein [Eubacteriales bacterium]
MKKLISALLALTLTLSICACSLAEGSTVTLAQLKATAPKRLQMTVTTDAGETITVDAPVILPDTDALPVLLTQSQTFDMTKAYDYYPLQKGTPTYEWYYAGDHTDHDTILYCAKEARSYLLNGKTDYSKRSPLAAGELPPENDFSLDEAVALIMRNNELFGGDPKVDLRVNRAVAMSGLCRMKSEKVTDKSTGVSVKMMVADPKRPIKGCEKGLWLIELAQYLYGARVLPGFSISNGVLWREENQFVYAEPTYSSCRVQDEESFHLVESYLSKPEILVEDAPLCPWNTVAESIRALIQNGQIKSVYQIELGYQVAFLRSENDAAREQNAKGQSFDMAQAHYVLLPCWELKGYALNKYNQKYFAGSESPDEETVLSNGFGLDFHQDNYRFCLHAKTAQPLAFDDLLYDLP